MSCKVCLGEHDRAIHDATLRVHSWLKQRMALVVNPVALPPPQRKSYAGIAAVRQLLNPTTRRKRETCPTQK
jgi:hypothetical protein